MLNSAAARLLRLHLPPGAHIDWQRIDPADAEAYWRLVAHSWAQPGSTLVVEQDVGIRAGVIEELEDCPEPWCGFPTAIGAQLLVCLGCTKFSAALKAAEPDLLDVVGEDGTGGLPARDWRRLDVRILDELRRRGYTAHRHEPPVAHFHQYPAV